MHVAFIIFHVQSGSVQRCIFHAFLFFYIFSVHRHPHPRSLIFKYGPISALYCVFNVYTVQESCLFTKLFNSVFSIFSSRNEMLFSNIRVVVGKKTFFSVYFAFLSHNMLLLTRCYFLFTTPPQKGHYFSLTG